MVDEYITKQKFQFSKATLEIALNKLYPLFSVSVKLDHMDIDRLYIDFHALLFRIERASMARK